MILGRVTGSVVSSHKEELLEGSKFLIVEKLDAATMKGSGGYVIAIDSVGAVVFFVAGSSARMTAVTQGRPADATITAIVDLVTMDGTEVYRKDAP